MWKQLKYFQDKFCGRWSRIVLAAPCVAGLVIAVRLTGILQLLEWSALDLFFQMRPPEPRDDRIVIVGISESDIEEVGTWPIPDDVIAQLILKLKEQKPRAIGLDIYRDLPVGDDSSRLTKVFETTPNLIGVTVVGGDDRQGVKPNPVLNELGQVAASDLILDADGKIRRGFLFIDPNEGEALPTLSLQLALLYLDVEGVIPKNATVNPNYLQLNDAVFVRFRGNDGGYIRTQDIGYQILVNFIGPRNSFEMVSMMDVLAGRIPDNFARDRIVLIGSTAASLHDYFTSPYHSSFGGTSTRTSGVEIHANLTSQIISAALDDRALIKVWPDWGEFLWILGWAILGTTLAWVGRYIPGKYAYFSVSWTTISILLSAIGLIVGSFLAFLAGWWIPIVPAGIALAGSAISITGYIAKSETEEHQMVMNLFQRHVTPKVAEAIWQNRNQILTAGELQGQEVMATVLFTDLKGFSTIAEGMDPKMLMAWLNEYMRVMAGIVLEHNGAIDKFIGDAIMAVFGVPIPSTTQEAIATDAQQAVKCAVAMAEALKSLNEQWKSQGKPPVAMRVGIATGMLVAGSLGSNQRQDYTVIGDTVNIAARLESLDKSMDYGICRILIAEETCRYLFDEFETRLMGSITLKGRKQPVNVYQVLLT